MLFSLLDFLVPGQPSICIHMMRRCDILSVDDTQTGPLFSIGSMRAWKHNLSRGLNDALGLSLAEVVVHAHPILGHNDQTIFIV